MSDPRYGSENGGKIVTRKFNYGDEKESSWPPQFGTGGSGVYHIDKDTGKLKEGHAPCTDVKYGQAPYVIGDNIDPYYHPAAQCYIDSKSNLERVDKAYGTITTDKKLPPNDWSTRERARAVRKDQHDALHKAVAQIDAGTAQLNEEQRALCDQQNEIVSSALNFDAFNVVGRKDNVKGKRFRRPGQRKLRR